MIKAEIEQYKEQLDKNPQVYKSFPEEAKNEKEITNYALDKDPFNMWYLSDRLKNDKDYAIYTLSTYPTFHMNKLGEKLQGDKEMVSFAMSRNQTFGLRDLEQVCKYFANDKGMINKAMEKLQENPLIVAGEVTIGRAIVANYQGKEAALEMVSKEPIMYRFLSEELRRDQDIALTAVKKEPMLMNEISKAAKTSEFYDAYLDATLNESKTPAVNKQEQKSKKSFDEMVKWAKGEKAQQKAGRDEADHDDRYGR